jgi:glycerate dehydrogenase
MAMAFGMKILVAGHPEKSIQGALPLDEVLSASDYLTLHLPLRESTKHLIGERELSLMKPTACLINTARGALIEERDLAAALKEKRIAGAALDVLSEEPPPPAHPLMAADIPNLILTPHIAWSSREARLRLIKMVEQNIAAFLHRTKGPGDAKDP